MEKRKNNHIILGIIIASIGVFLLIANFGLMHIPFFDYLFSWKTLLILVGIFMLVYKKNLTAGILIIGLGVIFWLPSVFNQQIELGEVFLPSLFIILGIIALLKAGGMHKKRTSCGKSTEYEISDKATSNTK